MSEEINRRLYDEMFEMMDNGTESESTIVEYLADVLYEDYEMSETAALTCANQFVLDNYEDIYEEVQRIHRENSEDYFDLMHDYYQSIGGALR